MRYRALDYKIWIINKYTNSLFPMLPIIIYAYLNYHFDEMDKFLSNKIILDNLLNYLNNKISEGRYPPLIELVKEYIATCNI